MLIDQTGVLTPLMDVPNTAARVTACGDQATSPNGRYFAFYVGADSGKLYLMDAAKAPILIDDVSFLACLSAFHYAPDSHRFAYIDYPSGATGSDFASGTLRLYDTDTLQAGGLIRACRRLFAGQQRRDASQLLRQHQRRGRRSRHFTLGRHQ